MIRAVFIFLLLLASIWLGIQLHDDPGYVLIALNHWTIEATVWTMLISLMLLFFILQISLLSFSWVIYLPHRWNQWLLQRRLRHLQRKKFLAQKRALKQSLNISDTPEAYFALGQLLDEIKDTSGACSTYREGLRRALAKLNAQI
jgi:uncharacterized protein HemY